MYSRFSLPSPPHPRRLTLSPQYRFTRVFFFFLRACINLPGVGITVSRFDSSARQKACLGATRGANALRPRVMLIALADYLFAGAPEILRARTKASVCADVQVA